MADHVIHISEAEAAGDFAGLLARVRAGAEVVIENGNHPVAVIHAPAPPRRSMRCMPSKSPETALRDILYHIDLAAQFAAGLNYADALCGHAVSGDHFRSLAASTRGDEISPSFDCMA